MVTKDIGRFLNVLIQQKEAAMFDRLSDVCVERNKML